MNRLVFAIDPGDKQSAYCVYDGKRPIEFGIASNEEVLALFGHLSSHYADPHPELVIEMIASYGMAVGANVFETCVWIGRFVQAWGRRAPCARVKRGEVKMHLCNSMRAKDSNVRQALIDRFGEPGTKKAPGVTYGISKDVWAAFALAVTHYDRRGE